ncbi:hypothetical protein GCM10027615_09100 [Plantactinospora veratri]
MRFRRVRLDRMRLDRIAAGRRRVVVRDALVLVRQLLPQRTTADPVERGQYVGDDGPDRYRVGPGQLPDLCDQLGRLGLRIDGLRIPASGAGSAVSRFGPVASRSDPVRASRAGSAAAPSGASSLRCRASGGPAPPAAPRPAARRRRPAGLPPPWAQPTAYKAALRIKPD